ncbi:MAG: glycosyltransferase family 2 protein [Chitinophagales bacterium]|nr:glycosyltransferase family 2 protein [Chitinophagaceae bacterium]MCB9065616.1 glycosyltransferase family 2 protein [Chitinophagales bacterium]
MKLSVVVITLNEEDNIERCLNAVQSIADEIVVIDSNSTDNTVQIAQKLGAKIVLQEFLGYAEQRNLASEKASYDWVLMLDADEVLSDGLQQGIKNVKENPKYNIYQLNRLTNYCGKWIKHSGWYPDKKIRLYNRNHGKWVGKYVHEYWQKNNTDEATGQLTGDLLHYSFNTISQHIKQIQTFTDLSARAAAENGKTCSLMKIWLGPKWFFISSYILKLGILDGYYGYLVCKFSAYAQMIKYSKTRQYAQMIKEGKKI